MEISTVGLPETENRPISRPSYNTLGIYLGKTVCTALSIAYSPLALCLGLRLHGLSAIDFGMSVVALVQHMFQQSF